MTIYVKTSSFQIEHPKATNSCLDMGYHSHLNILWRTKVRSNCWKTLAKILHFLLGLKMPMEALQLCQHFRHKKQRSLIEEDHMLQSFPSSCVFFSNFSFHFASSKEAGFRGFFSTQLCQRQGPPKNPHQGLRQNGGAFFNNCRHYHIFFPLPVKSNVTDFSQYLNRKSLSLFCLRLHAVSH